MATQRIVLSKTPTDIYDTLTLTSGQRYFVENVGATAAFLHEAENRPTGDALKAYHTLSPRFRNKFVITASTPSKWWAWADPQTTIVISPAA